ncbi:hypothetical protein K438DRAFT_1777096 [Mycena galopus ATCC 62051]|nr:hypothetical protein K438DRAFT_1777096 [Mycena galopus ATCC 62051]
MARMMCTFQVGSQKEAKANSNDANLVKEGRQCGMGWGAAFECLKMCMASELGLSQRGTGGGAIRRVGAVAADGRRMRRMQGTCEGTDSRFGRWNAHGAKPEGAQYAAGRRAASSGAGQRARTQWWLRRVAWSYATTGSPPRPGIIIRAAVVDIAVNAGGGIRTASRKGWQDLSRSGAVGGDKCGGSAKDD